MERILGIAVGIALIGAVYGIGLAADDTEPASVAAAAQGAGAEPAAVDDKGLSLLQNGHQHESGEVALDPDTQAELDAQLAVTREVASRYPTIADAVAAGYRRAGPFAPGLGIHYTRTSAEGLNADGKMSEADLENPLALIFDGTDPDAPLAGFMYYSMSADEPEGFAGPNDHWHYHDNVCLVVTADGLDAPLGADREVTQAQCAALGGNLMPVTQWMTHVWTVPGYENDEKGVFGELNPRITCSDGTYYLMSEEQQLKAPLNICRSAAA
jgi:hypothetical protein